MDMGSCGGYVRELWWICPVAVVDMSVVDMTGSCGGYDRELWLVYVVNMSGSCGGYVRELWWI